MGRLNDTSTRLDDNTTSLNRLESYIMGSYNDDLLLEQNNSSAPETTAQSQTPASSPDVSSQASTPDETEAEGSVSDGESIADGNSTTAGNGNSGVNVSGGGSVTGSAGAGTMAAGANSSAGNTQTNQTGGNAVPGAVSGGSGLQAGGLNPNMGRGPALDPNAGFNPGAIADNTIYLTFDNTPAGNFSEILRILDQYNAKATFFVWWSGSTSPMPADSAFKAIVEAGHSIGIHSNANTDSFSALYSSADYFMSEFNSIHSRIYEATGVRTNLYRLPGGSYSPDPKRQSVINEVRQQLDAKGFIQFDWTVSAEDAVNPSLTSQQILDNLYEGMDKSGSLVVLCHDGTGTDSTIGALERFVAHCTALGYHFEAISSDTAPVSFIEPR
ncbi:MAG: polysaccharide deacetylase family protein [Oscillospiraceae bacterium]|nr:polysaccharide deacetylase family protein [Oscillospiraceae bacterium]